MTNEIVVVKVVPEVNEVVNAVRKHIELKQGMSYQELSMLHQKTVF